MVIQDTEAGYQWLPRQFVGGTPCLDLANTVVFIDDPLRRQDRLRAMADVVNWVRVGRIAASVSEALSGEEAELWLSRLRAIREQVDLIFRSVAHRRSPGADSLRDLLLHWSESLDRRDRLVVEGAGLRVEAGDARPPSLHAVVAQSAVELLLSRRVDRVRACPSCGWLFVDTSRNGKRVWCDMAICGNRAKARRHRARQKPDQRIDRTER